MHSDNGECEDGGLGAISDACAFGTDCSDCGIRVRSPPSSPPSPLPSLPPPSPPLCIGVDLLNGVPLLVAPPTRTTSTLVLSNLTTGMGALSCTGLLYERSFGALSAPTAGDSGQLLARIQGQQYLSEGLTAAAGEAASVRGVLRTLAVRIDRNKVMVSYQLHDVRGNVRVKTQGLGVEFGLAASGMSTLTATCSVSLRAQTHYLGHCVLRFGGGA